LSLAPILLKTMELLLAIDAGLDSEGQDFIEALKQLNRLPGEVRALLITHWHNDHAMVLLKGLLEEAPPRAVAASHHVHDGERIEYSFIAIASPAHTPGHVAYFHAPSRALFCGNALAVVDDRLRLMSRPVTPDRVAARASAIHCLKMDPAFICPGHRAPLIRNVASEVERFRRFLIESNDWPLFG